MQLYASRVFSILFAMSCSETSGGSGATQTWIWGEGVPDIVDPDSDETEFDLDYPEHGFIQIDGDLDEMSISIELVRRPPSSLYPESEPFCSKMLPAAIADFMEVHLMTIVTEISVFIYGHPYIAACKCYVRTMMQMGLGRIEDELISSPNMVEEFCARREAYLFGKPVVDGAFGHTPDQVSQRDLNILRHSVTSVLVANDASSEDDI